MTLSRLVAVIFTIYLRRLSCQHGTSGSGKNQRSRRSLEPIFWAPVVEAESPNREGRLFRRPSRF